MVSSHTPARGVSYWAASATCVKVFQVIPPRGGYQSSRSPTPEECCFKSYPREGGIPKSPPARRPELMFQVIPPRGGYPAAPVAPCGPAGFKSYPREGGIAGAGSLLRGDRGFKSYPREGGIQLCGVCCAYVGVSSHTPARGVSGISDTVSASTLFQVIPPRGGYRTRPVMQFIRVQFQVIPPRGGYPQPVRGKSRYHSFKSYPREGGICKNIQIFITLNLDIRQNSLLI